MSFSNRQGIEPARSLQFDSMDRKLRDRLWNVLYTYIVEPVLHNPYDTELQALVCYLWTEFFTWPLDSLDPPDAMDSFDSMSQATGKMQKWFLNENLAPWNRAYDFVELVAAVASATMSEATASNFKRACNHAMEREASAYRFIGDMIGPLTNDMEIDAIEEVAAESGPLALVGTHIKDAIRLLSMRPEPDCRNSMKESISAVEAVVKIITGQSKGTLGKMLEICGPQLDLHASLVTGFKAFYGYTSDDHGIRHAMKDDRTPELEDARYFLVSCSAFAHYLIEKARKLGVISA